MKRLSQTALCASLALTLVSASGQEVVINEIMYHPASADVREEFVELFNAGTTNVDLTDWRISAGIDFVFPGGTTLGPGKYLVVAAHLPTFNASYPGVTNAVGSWLTFSVTNILGRSFTNWTPILSNTRNTLDLENAAGQRLDSVTYADEGDWAVRQRGPFAAAHPGWIWFKPHDGLGKSLELINPSLPNEHGQNWSSSLPDKGTPGAENSMRSGNVAPLILNVRHSPVAPRSTDAVSITARVMNETALGVTVTLQYRFDSATPPPFSSAPMFDDGAHADGVAGDGIFGAILPAMGNDTLVEFYVEAADAQSNTRTWPGPAIDAVSQGSGPLGQVANAVFQVDDTSYPLPAPLYKLVMTAAEVEDLTEVFNSDANSDAEMNATFISIDGTGIENRYLATVRNRGHGSRGGNPHNYRVNFRSDDRWKGITGLNLNARSVPAQHFGATLAQKSGVAGGDSRAVQWRVNNGPGPGGTPSVGHYAANEDINADWAEHHFPLDSGGNAYKVIRDIPPPNFDYRGENPDSYRNTYFKESNTTEDDFRDLMAMLSVMGENSTDLFTPANVRLVINLEQWLAHMAVMNLFGNSESGLNSGNNDDYFMYRGAKDPRFLLVYHDLDSILGQGSFGSGDDIFRATCCPISGDTEGTWRAMNRFLHSPDFEPMYYRTLQRLLDTTFSAAQFDALIDQTLGSYVPVNTINAMKTWMNARRAFVQSVISPVVTPPNNPPTATISGVPRSPTFRNSATLTVGGVGVTHYRYKLNDGAISPETPVATPITLSGLPNGSTNRVTVVGRTTTTWQTILSATVSRPWVVNAAWPAVRFNEVLARNDSAVAHSGTFPDLIELYNEGTASVDLSGLRLTDDPAEPGKFVFLASTTLAAGAYLLLYANNPDGTPGIHLRFSLGATGDGVYLFDRASNGDGLLDSVQFGLQLPNLSIGRIGNSSGDWVLAQPAFGSVNVAQPMGNTATLKINEWLAAGQAPLSVDFIELYNPDPLPVSLDGLHLTDAPLGAPALHRIAPLTFLAGGGYVAFIADGDTGAGADHLGFRLAAEQGQISLSSPELTVIDCVVYGPQRTDVSMGRCPNGSSNLSSQSIPTPAAPNACPTTPPPPTTVTLVNYDSVWRYDQVNGYDGVNWFAPGFNDSAWPSGQSVLGSLRPGGSIPEPVRTPMNTGRATYYFRSYFTVPAGASFTSLQITHVIDDGMVVYLNGQDVYRYNLPLSGPIFSNTLAAVVSGDPVYQGPFNIPSANLVPGQNVIAVELHQNAVSSPDFLLGLKLDGLIVTNSVASAGVVLNEVLANNATAEVDGRTPDWIELYNPSAAAVDLAGMSLNDQLNNNPPRWVFPAGSIIPARGYLVLYADADSPVSSTNTGFGLKANGGSVFLFKKAPDNLESFDRVDYGLQTADFSIGRVPVASTNWVLNLPTAGATNIPVTLGTPLALRLNEWMADPASGDDWFEIYNGDPRPVSLAGLGLTDVFGDLTPYRIPPLSFIGTRSNAFQRFEADEPATPSGPEHVDFKLSRNTDSIYLLAANGSTQIDAVSWNVAQQTGVSEGRLPDGAPNIVRFPETPTPSDSNFLPMTNVVVSEVLSHTDLPFEDAIELHNVSASPVNVSGWLLSDDKDILRKFAIPAGTPAIPPGGFKVFYEVQFNNDSLGTPFSLSSAKGDQVYLSSVANGQANGFRAIARFGPAENGVSFGRYRTSIGAVEFTALSQRTFGADAPATVEAFRTGAGLSNAYPRVGPIIVSEVMYHPADVGTNDNVIEEFIELTNTGSSTVPLYDPAYPTNGWRLRDAVDFKFNSSHSLPAGGSLLVVSFDPLTNGAARLAFQSRYGSNSLLVGPYSGKLDNSSESVELAKPDAPQTTGGDAGLVPYILVEKVVYQDRGFWPTNADGHGMSLQRVNSAGYANDPIHWIAALPTPAASGVTDTDGDGMPDDWEMVNGFNKNSSADANGDTDGDGLTNLQEFMAGTNPQSAASNLRLAGAMNGGMAALSFQAVAGKTYSVLYADGLPGVPGWTRLIDVPPQGANGSVTIQDPMGGQQRFYRIVTPARP